MIVQDSPRSWSSGRRVLLYNHSSPTSQITSIPSAAIGSSFLFIPVVSSSSYQGQKTNDDSISASSWISPSNYLKFSSFIYSLTNITSLAIPYILKDTLHLSPSQLGLFSAVCATPSFLKPVYSFMIPRTSRPMALFLCSTLQTAAFITIGTTIAHGSSSLPIVLGCLLAHSVASSIGMFIRDSMTIELVAATNRDSQHDAHNVYAELSMIARIGLVPVAYLSGYLLTYVTPAQIVTGAAIFPATIAVASAMFLETPESSTYDLNREDEWKAAVLAIRNTDSGLLSTVSGRSLFLSVIPSYADAMFFYYSDYMGFSAEFMGRFQFLGAIAGIIANAISKATLPYIDPRKIANTVQWLLIPTFSSILIVTQYPNLPHIGTFILARHFLVDFFTAITALPAAMELMQSAPRGAEGTYLALVGTLGNVGGAVNSLISSATMNILGITATNFDNISSFIGLTIGMSAISTPLVLFKDDDNKQQQKNEPKIEEEELDARGA